eukprot:scaffold13773_cov68-Phaeocystis_antarctica.AAC.2
MNNLGMLLKAKGDLATAEPLYREALGVLRETLGNRHPDTLGTIYNLGSLLEDKGELSVAEPLFREALGVWRETLGSQHPHTLIAIQSLARCAAEGQGSETARSLARMKNLIARYAAEGQG